MYNDQHGECGSFNSMFIAGLSVSCAHPRDPQDTLRQHNGEESHLLLRSSKTKLDKTTFDPTLATRACFSAQPS